LARYECQKGPICVLEAESYGRSLALLVVAQSLAAYSTSEVSQLWKAGRSIGNKDD